MTSRWLVMASVWACVISLEAQTTHVDLGNQGKNVDFTAAATTKPFKSGTVLPSFCKVGETFFKTNGAPGFNFFGCVTDNTWSLQNGAGVSSVGDLAVAQVS